MEFNLTENEIKEIETELVMALDCVRSAIKLYVMEDRSQANLRLAMRSIIESLRIFTEVHRVNKS